MTRSCGSRGAVVRLLLGIVAMLPQHSLSCQGKKQTLSEKENSCIVATERETTTSLSLGQAGVVKLKIILTRQIRAPNCSSALLQCRSAHSFTFVSLSRRPDSRVVAILSRLAVLFCKQLAPSRLLTAEQANERTHWATILGHPELIGNSVHSLAPSRLTRTAFIRPQTP